MEENLGPTTLPWAMALRALTPEILDHRAKQVAELADHPGWQFLSELTTEKVQRLRDALLPPKTYQHHEYVAVVNQEFGMRAVRDFPEAVRVVAEQVADEQRHAAEVAARKERS